MRRVAILLTGTLGACTANSGDESFIVRDNLAPNESACMFTTDLGAASISRGIITTKTTVPYLLNPLLESRIVAAQGKESLRTILVKGAHIDLTVGPTEVITPSTGAVTVDTTTRTYQFDSLTSAALPPNGGLATAQFDGVSLAAIADVRAAAGSNIVHAQATVKAVVFGDFYGEELDSNAFQYPVTICNDCVIGATFPNCTMIPAGSMVRAGNPCSPFQDGIVDCCLDVNNANALVCPAPASG
jgi:hypothetical protein